MQKSSDLYRVVDPKQSTKKLLTWKSAGKASQVKSMFKKRTNVVDTAPEVAPGFQLHVRGCGVHGWDGTTEGKGTYEDERVLAALFSQFGTCHSCTVRHRIEDTADGEGENTSWALVTMGDKESVDAALAAASSATGLLAGTTRLGVTAFDYRKAKASHGGMVQLKMQQKKKVVRDGHKSKAMAAARKAAFAQAAFANYVPPEEDSDDEARAGPRTGKELWSALRHRWKVYYTSTSILGRIREIYGHGSAEAAHNNSHGALAELKEKAGSATCFWVPDEPFRQKWDLFLVVMVGYVAIVYPYRVAWDVVIEPASPAFWFDVVVDLYFVLDMGLNFRTAVVDPRSGTLVFDRKSIAKRYLSTWFIIDLISSLPLHYVALIQGNENTHSTRSMKTLRILRLAKMLRIIRIASMLERTADTGLNDLLIGFKTLGMMVVMLWITHVLCCAWYYIGSTTMDVIGEPCQSSSTCGSTATCIGGRCEQYGWARDNDFNWSSAYTHYLTAFHSVNPKLSTIGDGIVVARTNAELLFSIVSEFACMIVFGVLAGALSNWISAGKVSEQLYRQRMDSLVEFLRAKRFPYEVRKRVRTFYAHLYANKTVFDEEQILGQLPAHMSNELVFLMYQVVIESTPFFSGLPKDITVKLCLAMKPYPALNGDLIMAEGEVGSEMFLIMRGKVTISRKGRTLGVISHGSFFGEMALIAHDDGPANARLRKRTATAATECELCFLARTTVLLLCQECPELDANLWSFVDARSKRVMWKDKNEHEAEQEQAHEHEKQQDAKLHQLQSPLSRVKGESQANNGDFLDRAEVLVGATTSSPLSTVSTKGTPGMLVSSRSDVVPSSWEVRDATRRPSML